MTTIQALQHIFSNVEKEQSPRGRGGFQTLFHSPALTEAEVEETEARFLYFASKVEPVKRLFFTISTGKAVVAQVLFLPTPDQFGRGGRYFAHGLLFAPDDFSKFQADPFYVFRVFKFISTVDGALAQGDFNSGHIAPVSLELPATQTSDVEAARTWPAPELQQLALLALRVEQQAGSRDAITVTGQPEHIENALEAAFLTAPNVLRPKCSFDTYFYRCNLVATYFWAIGLPEPPVSVKFVHVDGDKKQIAGEVSTQPQTAYERWAMRAIEDGQLTEIARQRNHAFALAEWLDDRPYDLNLLNQVSADLITAVFKVSPPSVQAAVQRGVRQKLPAELASRAAAHIYQHTPKANLYKQLRQGFETSHLVNILYDSYAAENFKAPPKQEVKALDTVLEQTEHPMLRLFVAYWLNARKELPKVLKRAEQANYQQFAETALRLKLVEPLDLLIANRAHEFLDVYLSTGVDNMPELVEQLIEAEAFDCLPRLNDLTPDLSRKDLNKLARLVAEHEQTPESFQQAVDAAINALPPEEGLGGKLKGMWRSLSGG